MRKAYKSQQRFKIPVEWITFTIASLVVAVLVGLILLTWVKQSDEPPVLSVLQESEVRVAGGEYYVPFTLKNTGGTTAESVQVVGELRQGNELLESGEQQIDFLSSGEQQEGAFVFSQDPRRGQLTIRVASYKLP
jgi:uncharacterized protein (TIGR02588 family)